ncbi:MAG: hypothetical protein ACK58X_04315 [Planctomycetota bacterium]
MSSNVPFRLRIGELVGRSFEVYLANLAPFLLLSAIVFVPGMLVTYAALSSGADNAPTLVLVAGILTALAGQLLTGALTYAVVQKLRGEPAPVAEVLSIGVRSLLRVLLVGIVTGVCIGIGMIFLIVPGMILMTWFYVAVPAAVVERIGLDAMGRSRTLSEGSRWQIFGAVLLLVLASAGLNWLLTQMTEGMGMAGLLLQFAVEVALGPLGATMAATCYFMLRVGKENVDASKLAAVFD